MIKGLGDLGQIFKLQKEFKNIQNRLKKERMEGVSPGGRVRAVVDGEYMLHGISIDDEIIDSTQSKELEAEVVAAVNDAIKKMRDHSVSQMNELTGGLNIPGMSDFLKNMG